MEGARRLLPSIVVAVVLLSGVLLPVQAQTSIQLSIQEVNSTQFPQVVSLVSISDAQGLPILGLGAEDFSLFEDGNQIADFEVEAITNTQQPLAIVIAIDTSQSMWILGSQGNTPLDNAIRAAKDFVDTLAPQDQVALIGFSDQPDIIQVFTSDKDAVKNQLDLLPRGTKTAMYDAVVSAVGLLKNRSERRSLILLTDGQDDGSSFDFDQAIDEAARWSVQVNAIGFSTQIDEVLLSQMAALTGGSVQIEPDSTTLASAFSNLLDILREQYQITFTSGLAADNTQHNLTVAVDAPNGHAEATHLFIATPGEVTITLPGFTEGQVIGGKLLFAPEVTAPAAVKRLDVTIDGQVLSSVLAAPFELAWDATATAEGSHAFAFKVEDEAGNTSELNINLTVAPPLKITIISPTPGAELGATVNIAAQVESLAGLAKVEFLVNGAMIASFTEAPFEASWRLEGTTLGEYTIQVNAVDVVGNQAQESITLSGGFLSVSGWLIALGVALLLAGVLIPLGLRRRREMSAGGTFAMPVAGRLVLRELQGMNPHRVWPLGDREIRLGRKRTENDIHLQGRTASRYHALVRPQAGGYTIASLSPSNPVIVNGQPVQGEYMLRPGDTFQLGESIFRVETL